MHSDAGTALPEELLSYALFARHVRDRLDLPTCDRLWPDKRGPVDWTGVDLTYNHYWKKKGTMGANEFILYLSRERDHVALFRWYEGSVPASKREPEPRAMEFFRWLTNSVGMSDFSIVYGSPESMSAWCAYDRGWNRDAVLWWLELGDEERAKWIRHYSDPERRNHTH